MSADASSSILPHGPGRVPRVLLVRYRWKALGLECTTLYVVPPTTAMGDRSMSIIAEFSVPAEEFALYETLCEVPGMTVEVERVVAHEADCIVPYFWTSGEN